MKVYINNSKNFKDPRQVVEVVLVKENTSTIVVRLPDGNIITRKKNRDMFLEEKK